MIEILKIQNQLNIKNNDIVLEIGSGGSPLYRSDILLDKYPIISKEHRTSGQPIKLDRRPFIIGDAHYLPFKDGAFDFVVARHILEHLNDPYQFVTEIKRISHGFYIASPSPFTELIHGGFNSSSEKKNYSLCQGKGTPGHKWFVLFDQNNIYLHAKNYEIRYIYLMFNTFIKRHTMYLRYSFFKNHPDWKETSLITYNCNSINLKILKDIDKKFYEEIDIFELIREIRSINYSYKMKYRIKELISRILFPSSNKIQINELLACPICKNNISQCTEKYICINCGSFPIINGIPILLREALNSI